MRKLTCEQVITTQAFLSSWVAGAQWSIQIGNWMLIDSLFKHKKYQNTNGLFTYTYALLFICSWKTNLRGQQ